MPTDKKLKKKKSLGNISPSKAAQEIKEEIIAKCRLLASGKVSTAQPIVKLTRELLELEDAYPVTAEKAAATASSSKDDARAKQIMERAKVSAKEQRAKIKKRRSRDTDEEDF